MQNHKQRTGVGVGLPLVGEHQTTTVSSLLSWFHKCEYQQGVLWRQGACLLLSYVNVVHHTLRPVEVIAGTSLHYTGNCHSVPEMMSGSSHQFCWILCG